MNRPRKSAPIGNRIAPKRFLLFVAVMIAGFVGLRAGAPAKGGLEAAALAFDGAALVFLVSLVPLLRDSSAEAIRAHAAENDANRGTILAVATLLTMVAMAAIVGELPDARHGDPGAVARLVGTLLLVWLFANSVYALHYAHIYYTQRADGGDRGGLEFPDTKAPSYGDFAYFAFTLGMTFQTSDVAITSRPIRRIALAHCFAAFVFNIGVIAFTINVLGGLAS